MGGGACGGGWCQAELVWPVFCPLAASGGPGGAEWARVASPEGKRRIPQAQPRGFSGTFSLTTSQETEPPGAAGLEAGF